MIDEIGCAVKRVISGHRVEYISDEIFNIQQDPEDYIVKAVFDIDEQFLGDVKFYWMSVESYLAEHLYELKNVNEAKLKDSLNNWNRETKKMLDFAVNSGLKCKFISYDEILLKLASIEGTHQLNYSSKLEFKRPILSALQAYAYVRGYDGIQRMLFSIVGEKYVNHTDDLVDTLVTQFLLAYKKSHKDVAKFKKQSFDCTEKLYESNLKIVELDNKHEILEDACKPCDDLEAEKTSTAADEQLFIYKELLDDLEAVLVSKVDELETVQLLVKRLEKAFSDNPLLSEVSL